jgi:hypothetical protein
MLCSKNAENSKKIAVRLEPDRKSGGDSLSAIAVEMTMLPIAAASMPAAGPAIRNAEHALDAANRSTDAGADRTTDRAADRTGRAIALAGALVRTALHASDHALRVGQMWHGQQG